MVNSTTNTSADIAMKSEKLEEVTSLKYLGTIVSMDGTSSTAEVRIRIAMVTAAMARRTQ
ncbi:hypothetical protein DPMN_109683 [Dreissena polymorpha]|uniref:Uncharacterized protein n=1 Tax=Dreissena polymorpha TaxID=45954 RepID=A0A9D4KB50_DREPO|nr:hypothetical protein DPMN_109683 [Dreissena polymorpha]